jgi:hypothetical protein
VLDPMLPPLSAEVGTHRRETLVVVWVGWIETELG